MSRGVFIYLTPEELAAVGAFFADHFRPLHQSPVVNQRRATFSARRVVFGFVEAKAADMADSAQRASLVGGHHALRGIFHHEQIMFFGDGHDGVHFTGHARVVNRHDRARFVGDRRFNQRLINVHGVRADIHKDDFRSAQDKGVRRGNEGIARHNHFIAGLDIQQQCRHFQRCRTGRGQQHFGAAKTLFHPLLTATGKTAVTTEFAAAHGRLHIVEFSSDNGWCVKWNHLVTCITSRRWRRCWHHSQYNV